MLYRHVFDKISTEFHGISRILVNFAALLLLKISEALYLWAASFTFYKVVTKNLHLATIFLRLVATRRPEDFFNFEPWNISINREIYCTYVTLGLLLLSFCVPRLKYTVLQRDLFFRFPTYCKARQVTFALSTHKSLPQPRTAHRFAKKAPNP